MYPFMYPFNLKKIFSGLSFAIASTVILTGCAQASSTSTSTTSQTPKTSETTNVNQSSSTSAATSTTLPSLNRLTSLTNYSYTMTVGTGSASLTMTGQIHSQSNFEISLGTTHTYLINSQAYEVLGNLAPQKITLNPTYFQQQGIIAAANTFFDLTKASGVKVEPSGSCTIAGLKGTLYKETTPSNAGIFKIAQVGCVANSGGALLSFNQGDSGSAAPGGGGQKYFFEVTGVNNVSKFVTP